MNTPLVHMTAAHQRRLLEAIKADDAMAFAEQLDRLAYSHQGWTDPKWVKVAIKHRAVACLERQLGAWEAQTKNHAWLEAMHTAIQQEAVELFAPLLQWHRPEPSTYFSDLADQCLRKGKPHLTLALLKAGWPAQSVHGEEWLWRQAVGMQATEVVEYLRAQGHPREVPKYTTDGMWSTFITHFSQVPPAIQQGMAERRLGSLIGTPTALEREGPTLTSVPLSAEFWQQWVGAALERQAIECVEWGLAQYTRNHGAPPWRAWKDRLLEGLNEPGCYRWEAIAWMHQHDPWTAQEQQKWWGLWLRASRDNRVALDDTTWAGGDAWSRGFHQVPSEEALVARDHRPAVRQQRLPRLVELSDAFTYFLTHAPALVHQTQAKEPVLLWRAINRTVALDGVALFARENQDWDAPLRVLDNLREALGRETPLYRGTKIHGIGERRAQNQHLLAWWDRILNTAPDAKALDRPGRGVIANHLALGAPLKRIQALLDAGFDPSFPDAPNGWTPAQWVVWQMGPALMHDGPANSKGWSGAQARAMLERLVSAGQGLAPPLSKPLDGPAQAAQTAWLLQRDWAMPALAVEAVPVESPSAAPRRPRL